MLFESSKRTKLFIQEDTVYGQAVFMTMHQGSVGDPWLFGVDPDPDPTPHPTPVFRDFMDAEKNNFIS